MQTLFSLIPFFSLDAKSYDRSTTSSGKLTVKIDYPGYLNKSDVLIVEDIIDTRRTLDVVIDNKIKERNTSSLRLVED